MAELQATAGLLLQTLHAVDDDLTRLMTLMNDGFDRVDSQFERLIQRLDRLIQQFDKIKKQFDEIKKRR